MKRKKMKLLTYESRPRKLAKLLEDHLKKIGYNHEKVVKLLNKLGVK